MNLRDWKQTDKSVTKVHDIGAQPRVAATPEYYATKAQLHNQLLGRIDLEVLGSMAPARLRSMSSAMVGLS